ncbi:MAG: DUF2250 domain-containing protein [Clostridiales bacterium]|nr:DUF2250 domain-containing protein [Clostridiales bacterium]MCF8023176.1 DUF2250 domain-containing protein [Clostridiales bacterium]
MFNSKYLTSEEIRARVENLIKERDETRELLSRPEVSTDPERMPGLAQQLEYLNYLCAPAEKLQGRVNDLQELEDILSETGEDAELEELYEEYKEECAELSSEVYNLLLENGYLEEEIEDDVDHEILKFIEYAGPEYAWRLGINLGLTESEARHRLEVLLKKDFLKRVEGTMLHNYHRQKDWTKHMNHKYYRLSRKAELYLRQLKREL